MRAAVLAAAALACACSTGTPPPAVLDTRNEACGFCRMTIADARFAGQIVAPSEEPRFFDDVGCLGRFVQEAHALPEHAVAYVADHRTKAWVRADTAVYTRVSAVETPMGSHLLAHADAASRDADPMAAGGDARTAADVFGPKGPPRGAP
jgi:copper chaperone NosL